jgi:hypothetical protein
MKEKAFLLARVAGLVFAFALLASCNAPIVNQNGYINFDLQFANGSRFSGAPQAVVLVVNSGYQDTLAELLNLIGKSHSLGSLPSSDQDRLKTLGKELSTSGLVDFGGFPFYQTTLSSPSGSFKIPGVPGGRTYFVKLFIFVQGYSFKAADIDQNFWTLIQQENLVFQTETYTTDTAWQGWTPLAGQPVAVIAGQSAAVSVTLVSPP